MSMRHADKLMRHADKLMRHADKLILVVGPDQTSCSLGGNVNQLSVPTLM